MGKNSHQGRPPFGTHPALPAETSASAAYRAELLAEGWYDSAEVAQLLGSQAGDTRLEPAALRRAGALLGVWVPAERDYRHPPCQFGPDRQLLPQLRTLLAILPNYSGSGWEQAEWIYSPHALLDQRPADLLPGDPERVIAAALREFGEERDTRW